MGQRSRHEVDVEVFFDFTCEFSYRARHWLEGMEGMEVIRRPLSLLEVTATTTAVRFARPELADNVSLVALAAFEALSAAPTRRPASTTGRGLRQTVA